MSLVMFPACAKAADGAEPTQERIKTKAAGSLARELVIQGPPFVICSPGSSTVLGPRHPPSRCGEDVHEASPRDRKAREHAICVKLVARVRGPFLRSWPPCSCR